MVHYAGDLVGATKSGQAKELQPVCPCELGGHIVEEGRPRSHAASLIKMEPGTCPFPFRKDETNLTISPLIALHSSRVQHLPSPRPSSSPSPLVQPANQFSSDRLIDSHKASPVSAIDCNFTIQRSNQPSRFRPVLLGLLKWDASGLHY